MNYIQIDNCNLLNGEGARVVLWVAGCTHKCDGCHNPHTWNYNEGKLFDNDALEELLNYLDNRYISGLTISGGDPFESYNYEAVLMICKTVKEKFPEQDIWIWTGYLLEELINCHQDEIFNYIDYLIDGKYIKELKTDKLWRGSDNQKLYAFKNGVATLID